MSAEKWKDETFKESIKASYLASDPTPKTNAEILQELSAEFDVTGNAIRVFLVREGIYVKEAIVPKEEGAKDGKTPAKRVSKEAAIGALKAKLEELGKPVDPDILDKMTGKAAQYFLEVLS